MQRDPIVGWLALIACALALAVVVLGAWVRLSDAGLGCPDWPGCYGHIDVPQTEAEIEQANQRYEGRPVEQDKAWKEMIHRYAAGVLGLLVAALAATAWQRRDRGVPVLGPAVLLALVMVQALLGMWTVTLLLKPLIVLAHLAGGLAVMAGLAWVALSHLGAAGVALPPRWLRHLTVIALTIACCQIALGGWTSTNYAALACPDFPMCQGKWWPETDFATAFVPWHGLGIDYEGGILDGPARTAIHLAHRLGAIATTLVVGALVLACGLGSQGRPLRVMGALVGVALLVQLGLGIANVVWLLPLPLATAHNAGAALLLLALIATLRLMTPLPRHAR